MSWEVKIDTGQKRLALCGELTIFSVQDIHQRFLEVLISLDELQVDLSEVTEIDTAGLQLMLLAKRKAGKTVRFCNHSDAVLRHIDLANLGQALGDPLILRAQ